MIEKVRLSRRTVLRGLGTAIALPWLETFAPRPARGGEPAAGQPGGRINRMVVVYVPNGAHMAAWTPTLAGDDFVLPYILEPLAPFQSRLNVFTGLAADKARAHGDGGGDHARSLSAFLTGCQPKKTRGADIRVGVSVDQMAAERIGEQTRFPSLELGCDRGAQTGDCDSGYSCAYSHNISWRAESSPTSKEVDPRLVFERLFTDNTPEGRARRTKRALYQRSILDSVAENARDVRRQLGVHDGRKLDEYLTCVREIERRIAAAQRVTNDFQPAYEKPSGIPSEFTDHVRLMCDLMVLAMQGDLTRVITFVVADEGSNRAYPFLGVPDGHHNISHHQGDEEKQKKIAEINRYHATQFAYLLQRMAAVGEGTETLLDNSMVLYGSGISDGNRHNHDDLPIVLAGAGAGTIRTGRHVLYKRETPLTNLYLAMLDRLGAPTDRFGDSDGKLELG
ncbi:MAG TPA: DUF1552 domain-containing protein [Pirellulales bacterium]|jgi:hypothetical protein|nr:DUF1552 domain-containing protein [Pirellulales bacterium]